jgi:putative membrane protein
MQKERTFSQKIALFLKGLAMGAANKVPGVSGGTVSFVLGFYEELIYSFRKINFIALKLLINFRFKSFYSYVNGPFLLLVMGGSIFSYFSISLVLDYFLQYYELYVWSWFFGMIIGISVGLGISFLNPARENDNLWFVFICGIIGVSGMTLPGLSGSFILILMGNYVLLLVDSVNELLFVVTNLITGNFEVLEDPEKLRYLKIISVFTLGSVFGLVSISHILGYVLKRWNAIVTAIIIGFITGSLGIVWPWKKAIYLINNKTYLLDKKGNKIIENYNRFIPDFSLLETWVAIFYIIFGISLVLSIDYYGRKKE